MSCNCEHHHHSHLGPPHDCNHINHVFDPAPPTFYGTWNHLYGHDITNKVSMPGVQSGLYRHCGPLNCSCCGRITMLTGVKTSAKIILTVHLSYSDSSMNKSIDIEPGVVYTFEYLDEGEVHQCTGLVTNIYKVSQLTENTEIYKINVDSSTQYSHNVVVIKSDQLRGVVKYYPYYGEDTSLQSAYHVYGTTVAQNINDAVIIDAELDKDRNIVKGIIIQGTLVNAITTKGICIGSNSNKHIIVLAEASSSGGQIHGGYLINGVVASGDIDGTTEEDTGYIVHATIKGNLRNVLIGNSRVSGAYVKDGDGVSINPVLENAKVMGASITGEDMVTTGGITTGDITINGTTTGGVASGGAAIGNIEGYNMTILGGKTVPMYENTPLVTTGGIVVGGTIIGGKRVGRAIYDATIKGGVCTRGITTGGITTVEFTDDALKALVSGKFDSSTPSIIPGTFIPEECKPTNNWNLANRNHNTISENYYREQLRYPLDRYGEDDLVVATHIHDHSRVFTNFGNAIIDGRQVP